jgi:hypothetical protein
LVELASRWTAQLNGDEVGLAARLLSEIVSWARGRPATLENADNLGGRCLKLLIDRAKEQPEFREPIADAVHAVVMLALSEDSFWTGKADSLKLAFLYRDVWRKEQIRALLDQLPELLRSESAGGVVFVTRAALDLLRTPEVMEVIRSSPELGQRFFADVLHYSLAEHSDPITTLFNLAAFSNDAELNEPDTASVAQVVEEISKRAMSRNSSGATDAIRALFIAAAHTKAAGVLCAADSLVAILDAPGKGTSPAFAYAYDPVLDLVRSRQEIEKGSGLSEEEFQNLLDRIGHALVVAWKSIIADPARLAPFSLPPSREPNRILINNYAVATVQFAKIVSDPSELQGILELASEHIVLGDIVHRVVVTGSAGGWDESVSRAIETETHEAFYRLLGHRLAQAREADSNLHSTAMSMLLEQVLLRGPRELDLAVFAALPMSAVPQPESLKAYKMRLRAKPQLLQLLGALVSSLAPQDGL